MRTASPRARCRSKWRLSSREVKSTGENVRVVIFPSAVMAKVAMTKGRLDLRREDVDLGERLFRLADLMLERRDFMFHLAQLYVFDCAARPIKQINNAARQTAEKDD